MKNKIILIGVFLAAFFLVSNVVAVPQTNSKIPTDLIENIEEKINKFSIFLFIPRIVIQLLLVVVALIAIAAFALVALNNDE